MEHEPGTPYLKLQDFLDWDERKGDGRCYYIRYMLAWQDKKMRRSCYTKNELEQLFGLQFDYAKLTQARQNKQIKAKEFLSAGSKLIKQFKAIVAAAEAREKKT